MKLISMTDYVLNVVNTDRPCDRGAMLDEIANYAMFLKTPLGLGMFVPCDENNNILKEPKVTDKRYNQETAAVFRFIEEAYNYDVKTYNQAKERVIFEGWVYISKWYSGHLIARDLEGTNQFWTLDYDNIEELIGGYDITLTQNAIKTYKI